MLKIRYQTAVFASRREQSGALTEWTSEIAIPVAVVATGQDTVSFLDDEAIDSGVREAMRVGPVRVGSSFHDVPVTFATGVSSLPVDLAFDVRLRLGAESAKIGEFTAIRRAQPQYRAVGTHYLLRAMFSGRETVDIVLHPSVDVAERTVEISRIWGRELIFEKIRVQWVADDPPSP